jgi:hypothetical protein
VIIGCGKWGINNVRTAYQLLGERLKCGGYPDIWAYEKIKSINQFLPFTQNLEKMIYVKEINSLIMSILVETHYGVAQQML